MNEHFSITRLWWLLRADMAGGHRSLLTISGALAGVILIAALISFDAGGAGQGFYVSWFGGMLFVWGLIASSRAFAELHDKNRNQAYLLLPASALEKTVARLLAVTAGLCAYLLLFTTAVSLVVAGVFALLPGPGHGLFNPLDPQVRPMIAAYLFLQSFYFLGAAWFRRRHFIKTTLAITVAGIGLCLITFLALRIAFAPEAIADVGGLVANAFNSYQGLLRLLESIKTVFVVGLPVAFWSIAWLRVRETQVSDGI